MIRRAILTLSLILVGSAGVAAIKTEPTYACGDSGTILLVFKPWYYGISQGVPGACTVPAPVGEEQQRAFVWTIAMNIVENFIVATGLIAIGFVIYGGILFMLSTGDPGKAAEARKTIINALAGAVVAGTAVVLVNVVARTALGIN